MRVWLFVVLISVLGTQGHALSCKRPNIAETFDRFQEAKDVYRLMIGQVKITGAIPKYAEGKPRSAKARVTGKYVGRNALTSVQTVDVTVQTHCVAHWCGGFPQNMDDDAIIYVKQTPNGGVIDIHACPDGFGQAATTERVKLLQSCLRKGKCSNADIKLFELK